LRELAESKLPNPNQRPVGLMERLLFDEPPARRQLHEWQVDRPESSLRKKVQRDRENSLSIPYWSDTFTHQGLTYRYTIVGSDPKRGSATTTVPTVLIPIRFIFENGLVIDPDADSVDGETSIQGISNSPIFQSHDFRVGGISVGNTQYGDAFQRANFWDSVSRQSPDYHVLLSQPTSKAAFEVHVPDEAVTFVDDPVTGAPVPLIEGQFLVQATLDAIENAQVSSQTLPIVIWGNVFGLGFGAFHGAIDVPGGILTYIATGYHPRSYEFSEDTYYLSHEILEWLNDPFIDNFTPGWNFPDFPYPHCLSAYVSDSLEVADVLEFFFESDVPVNTGLTTYHLADAVFLDYFTRTTPSRSANGQYSFFNFTNAPSSSCAGHVEVDMKVVEYPNARITRPLGINNIGWIVGDFRDSSNRRHGFVYDGRSFTQLDYPSAASTLAYKINAKGQIAGFYFDTAGFPHGFTYVSGDFTPISFPGSTDTIARGINSLGDIVGLYDATQEITHGFIYQNGKYAVLDTPFAQQTDVTAINDVGQCVGNAWDDPFNGPFFGFVLEKQGFSAFSFPGASDTFPWTVNNSGMHGGTFFDPLFGSNGYVTIYNHPYEVYGNVFGMNDKGEIVGNRFDFISGRSFGYVAALPK